MLFSPTETKSHASFATHTNTKRKKEHQQMLQAKRGSQTRKRSILRENFITRISFVFLFGIMLHLNFGFSNVESPKLSLHFPISEAMTDTEFDTKFIVTGYYSPLPNQEFYVTGSYESEKTLNGEGIAGADGTGVFPGMIAAPKSYPFGTKICLQNYGCGAVHDRGGAIVEKGKRNIAKHDRLDLWMGYGEEGLLRALALGVQELGGKIYGSKSNIQTQVNFQSTTPVEQLLDLPNKKEFTKNLYKGSLNKKLVQELQGSLFELGFYSGEISGVFDKNLENSVFDFQKKYFILKNKTDQGAGGFGPKTRKKLSEILHKKIIQEAIQAEWEKFHFEKNLTKGHRSSDILKLQEVLITEEFMNHIPTGYFGKVTKNALVEFQIHHKIIKNKNTQGAGRVGPNTRKILNQIISQKKEYLAEEKDLIFAYTKQQKKIQYLSGSPVQNYLAFR